LHLNLANTTYGSNYKYQGNAGEWVEKCAKLNTNVETVLEEANVDGCLDDFMFVQT
jgi:hypothetical protein